MHGIVLTAAYSNLFYCRRAWEHLQFPVEDTNGEEDSEEQCEENNDVSVDILNLEPILGAVFDGVGYGLVGRKRTPKFQCLLCRGHCEHVRMFKEWCEENDIELESVAESETRSSCNCISYRYIVAWIVSITRTHAHIIYL